VVRGEPDWTKRVVVDVTAQIDPVPVAFEIEGDYETWEKLWDMAIPDGLYISSSISGIFSEDYLYLWWRDSGGYRRFAIYKLQDGTQVFLSPATTNYIREWPGQVATSQPLYNILTFLQQGIVFSIRCRYAVLIRFDMTILEVWKKGVKVWTAPDPSTIITGATEWYSMGISFDGKWLGAITDNEYLVIFKGKP